jgi:histidinol-phosphatase (PHP family)
MKVDYHIHLEEGPYSFRWLERTHQALSFFFPIQEVEHSRAWLLQSQQQLAERLKKGAYDPSWLDLYLIAAKQKGVTEVGIVDHLYRFRETRDFFEKYIDLGGNELGRLQKRWLNLVMTETMDDFVRAVEEAKERWASEGVILRLGIEADYFPGGEQELQQLLCTHEWDFVIGSVHFIDGWGFDNPETRDRFRRHDLKNLYGHFFSIVEQAVRSGLFDFVAHLDNLKVFGHRPDEAELIPYYHRIARALAETDTATEINAGLFYRYPIQEMCPSAVFLDILLQYDVLFTISSDAHFPDDLGKYVEDNMMTLMNKGVTRLATFEKRKRIMKEMEKSAPFFS